MPDAERSRHVVAILLGALILSWAMAWNGFPLIFPDSGAYVNMTLEGWKIPSRSPVYSYFLYAFHWNTSLWIPMAVQAIVVAHLIHLALRTLAGSRDPATYLLVVFLISVLTALPWYVGYLMADIFAPVAVLATVVLVAGGHGLSTPERCYLVVLAIVAVATHNAGPPLALGLAGVLTVLVAVIGNVRRAVGAAVWSLSIAAGGLAIIIGSNIAFHGPDRAAGYGQIFMLARLIGDGPAVRYLEENCDTTAYRLCAYRDRLADTTSGAFLWHADSPLKEVGGWEGLIDEADEIVRGTITAYPLTVARNAFLAGGRQYFAIRTGGGMNAYPSDGKSSPWLVASVTRHFPDARTSAESALQQQRKLPFRTLDHLHGPVLLVAGILSLVLLVPLWRRRQGDVVIAVLAVHAALLGNAALMGAVSAIEARYQTRVAWLLALTAMVQILALTIGRRRHRAPPAPAE